jgi:stage V sporulation protein G
VADAASVGELDTGVNAEALSTSDILKREHSSSSGREKASHRREGAMDISEVRIKLMENSDDRLQGFCSITFDNCFVVRDLKIIDGANGPFVAMPSRKLTSHCPQCGTKNHLKALYCNQCGARLREDRTIRDSEGRAKLYADIAHPINSQCREMIQSRVISEFRTEQERAKQPGYVSRYDDDYDDDVDPSTYTAEAGRPSPAAPATAPPPPAPAMPPGVHAQPPQSQPPPPHILPGAPTTGGSTPSTGGSMPSTGGPHFTSPPPQRETAREQQRDNLPKKQPPRGEFGAGIF